jgi:hypothetical protein
MQKMMKMLSGGGPSGGKVGKGKRRAINNMRQWMQQ